MSFQPTVRPERFRPSTVGGVSTDTNAFIVSELRKVERSINSLVRSVEELQRYLKDNP